MISKKDLSENAPEDSDLDTNQESTLMRLLSRAKKELRARHEQPAQAYPSTETSDSPNFTQLENSTPTPKMSPENFMGKYNQLYILEQRLQGNMIKESPEDITYDTYLGEPEPITPGLRRHFKTLSQIAQQIIAADEALEKQQPSNDKPISTLPGRLSIQVSENKMAVWLFLFPPLHGGEPTTMDMIKKELINQKITFGFNESLLQELVEHPRYFKLFVIARGTPSVNGQDGEIHDHFSREVKIHIEETESKTVDYKNLNWLQQIRTGEILCDIVAPTEAVNGTNVLGQAIKGIPGKKAIAPKGKNTSLNQEETALVAEVSGQVQFSKGQFHVEPLLTISGDVNTSVGNLDVIGNVVVHGDIRDGFIVKATGDITVKGKVEGAILIAGRNIQIGMGMNGNSRGSLDAGGDIQAKYLENCNARASGCIASDSIVNSNISSDDSVKISYGRGVIIGGTIMALNLVEAKCIGNKSSRTTAITLGETPSALKEKGRLEHELKKIGGALEETNKNISYLERGSSPTPEYRKMLGEFKLKHSMLRMQQRDLKAKINAIGQHLDPRNCRLVCKTIYPLTQITIGSATRTIRDPVSNCNIYYSGGEINIGVI